MAATLLAVGCADVAGDGPSNASSDRRAGGTLLGLISEAAPVAWDVTVTPAHARPGDELTCDWSFSSQTGGADRSDVRWLVDGHEVGSGPVLDTTGFAVGIDVVCEVVPSDGWLTGAASTGSARLPGNFVILLADDVGVNRVRAYGVGVDQPPMPVLEFDTTTGSGAVPACVVGGCLWTSPLP